MRIETDLFRLRRSKPLPVSYSGAAVPNPIIRDANISALLTGRLGNDGDTTYTDEFGNVWNGISGALLSASLALYPPKSLVIPTTTAASVWSRAGIAGFAVGAGDFAVELWRNQTSIEAVYIDNDAEASAGPGWRIGERDTGTGSFDFYWYSALGGYFPINVASQPTGLTYLRWERIGTAANNVSVYLNANRIGQYTDTTNYSRIAPTIMLGRAADNMAFRAFSGAFAIQITKGGNRGGAGGATIAVPTPYDFFY